VLCSVSASKAVLLWNMDRYTLIPKLKGHHNNMVSSSSDTRIIVWDHQKGRVDRETQTGNRQRGGEADGHKTASIADDHLVWFWKNVLMAGTCDGSVHFWECPPSIASLQHLCRLAHCRINTQQVEALPLPMLLLECLT
uniref:SOCS box domain-containing protein n=1 Tax=Takifugu rubripes TaxID=31033 RepID=A0A674N216_TAKRU